MVGSLRIELAPGSPERLAFAATYPNGQCRNYSSANLDRSGGFQKGTEIWTLSSGSISSRGSTILSVEMFPLFQCLMWDPITLGDQKFTCSGELSKVLGVAVGSTMDDCSFGPTHFKPSASIASGELKHFKASVLDTSIKPGLNISLLRQQPIFMDEDKDILRTGSGGSVQVEGKFGGLPPRGEEVRDKKMKGKHSVGAMVARDLDGDQELKWAMQQKLSFDPSSLFSDAYGFGSGSSDGVNGINNLDGTSQLMNSNASTMPGNELEYVSLSNNRRDCDTGLNTDGVVANNNYKLNIHKDNLAGDWTPLTEGKAWAPQSNSVVTNSYRNFPHTPGAIEGLEQTLSFNKVESLGGVNNQKCSIPTQPSSPVEVQWVDQRPQKISCTRRVNPASPVSNHDEGQLSSETFPSSDIGTRLTFSEANGSSFLEEVSNSTHQLKMKLENVAALARYSENEELGTGENKSRKKGVHSVEIEDRAISAVEKVESFVLPSRKNKIRKEGVGDGARRGRSRSLSRACVPPRGEKLENPAEAKPQRSTWSSFDKKESKSGHPPSKKMLDRKAFSHSRHALSGGSSDLADVDHKELLAAANYAHNASYLACSGSLWKEMEPIFASVTSEDTAYLQQQSELVCKEDPLPQTVFPSERQGIQLTGIESNNLARTVGSLNQPQGIDTSCGRLVTERGVEKVSSLYQRVLSAFIEVDDNDEGRHASFEHASGKSPCDASIHNDVELKNENGMVSEIGLGMDIRSQKHCSLDSLSCDKTTAFNSFSSPSISNPSYKRELWKEDDGLVSEVGVTTGVGQNLGEGVVVHMNISEISSFGCPYQDMCLDDKLIFELQSIDLYPEKAAPHICNSPAKAEGEEDIGKYLVELEEWFYEQVEKMKDLLSNLNAAVQKGREVEERDLEKMAMNKLVEMAHKKYMSCRGRGRGRKVLKKAALAFVKRTIERCRKFEDTGRSCFSEPALRDVILAAPHYRNGLKFVDSVRAGAVANNHVEAHNSQPDSGPSAVGVDSTMVELHGPHDDKVDSGFSDAFQAFTHSSDPAFAKHKPISNRRKEVLFDDVGSDASRAVRASSALGNSLGGVKIRRSGRDKDKKKDMLTRSSVAKAGRPALGSSRGERKAKMKPKQKIAPLSTSGNGLVGRLTGTTHLMFPSVCGSSGPVTNGSNKASGEMELLPPSNVLQGSSKETVKLVDVTNSDLKELESVERGLSSTLGGHQNINSLLNFGEEVQEHDSMGLEIPMDDLSELNMII